MVVYILLAMMVGHGVIITAKEYVPIAWHKVFKAEIMEKKAPVTNINTDIPEIENTEKEIVR